MTFRVYYGNAFAMADRDRHLNERVQTEYFSTEYEALYRARELMEGDEARTVAICDDAGNQLTGIRLQLKFGGCPV